MNEVEKKFWARFIPESLHPEETCKGQVCVVHNPLNHHMREWPMVWREDRLPPIVERICECGVGHPDPSQGESCTLDSRFSVDHDHDCCERVPHLSIHFLSCSVSGYLRFAILSTRRFISVMR